MLFRSARTPLIISGPVPKGDDQMFEQYRPAIDHLYNLQKNLVTGLLAEARQLIAEGKNDVRTAGGNVKLVNLSSNIASLLTSLLSGKVFLVLGLIGTVSSILGHFIGAGLAIKNGSKIVKPAIILVLVLLAAKVVQGLIAG